ncbi:hypothetical protein COUCH_37765 [Couchioplanes caeruleus]|uniref:hypothetical protein n=1 Tax=Couchioplanes caeruleus TaxID=56438 RepID=UPI0020BF7E28|nr:hypothetical protein [Couchioplanes caeruleus]UQU64625.1 hypothetical protein COUCH_37765 [Couchioplanes caeruleus]
MKKIISLSAVLLAGALTTGCANSGAAGAPAEPAALEQGRALYEQVSNSLYGTSADRLAAEKATAARFQGALATCMKAKGFTYRQAPSEQQTGGPIGPDDLSSLTEISDDFGIATAKHHQAEVADVLRKADEANKMTAEEEVQYAKALSSCPGVAAKAEQQASPIIPTAMGKELTDTFREVEKTPAVADALAAYGPCMKAAGIAAKDRSHAYQMALAKFPPADRGVAAMEADPQWAEAVAFEKKAAAADATCRQPAQDQALAAAAPRLQTFVTKYQAALDAADANWTKIRAEV